MRAVLLSARLAGCLLRVTKPRDGRSLELLQTVESKVQVSKEKTGQKGNFFHYKTTRRVEPPIQCTFDTNL